MHTIYPVAEKGKDHKVGQREDESPEQDEMRMEFEKELNEGNQEEFITPPKPRPFTRAKVDSVERRPAAVLTFCNFLTNLANKCKAELSKLGCTRPPHHTAHSEKSWEKRMMRLKVYQRAFSAIVMHFKAYSPVLFYIKKNYEDMLNYRVDQIKTAHFEKKRLNVQKQSMKRQIHEYQFPEIDQLHKSEKFLKILRQKIALQEEAIKVITGILRKMEESLSDHFERHRDLEEQIIMVDNEIANRRQKAFSMREKEEKEIKEKEKEAAGATQDSAALAFIENDEEDIDDPFYNVPVEEIDEERKMVWIMAFAICHKDLEEAERRLTLYQTKYQYVVPRHEHENMKRSIVDEKGAAKTLADERATLEEELANLKDLEEKLREELTEVEHQLTDLRTLVTPRPSWEQLGEFVQGGVPKWEKMIYGKSTKDVTDKLFSELRSKRGGDKFLPPLGVEPHILRCLRHNKKVSDRQLHSRDAALLIHDIWLSRKRTLDENFNNPKKEDEYNFGKPVDNVAEKSFADYVAIYFEENYEDVDQRMEWTYNLVEACKRFSLDYRLTLFLNVLQGKSDEGLYFITRNELFRVRNLFLEKSVEENMTQGTLSANMYVDVLEHTFPKKTDNQYQSLVRVTNKLNAELNPEEDADLSIYHITQLIDMRDDGFRGALVSEIVKQFEEDRQAYIDKIIGKIAEMMDISMSAALSETDPASNRDISIITVYDALVRADPDMDDHKAGPVITWVFTGNSVQPGCGLNPAKLLRYVKMHTTDKPGENTVPSGDGGHADDDNFIRAIQDVIYEEDDSEKEEQQLNETQKKAFYRSHKTAKLKTIVKRLKNSSLIPNWQVYNPKEDSVLPEAPINLETDLELVRNAIKAAAAGPDLPLVPSEPGAEDEGRMSLGGDATTTAEGTEEPKPAE